MDSQTLQSSRIIITISKLIMIIKYNASNQKVRTLVETITIFLHLMKYRNKVFKAQGLKLINYKNCE